MLKFLVFVIFIQSVLFVKTRAELYESTNSQLSDETKRKIDALEAEIEKLLEQSSTNSAGSFKAIPRHCKDVQDRGSHKTDVYYIQPEFVDKPFLALCDMNTTGGGWTYIMNRFDGSENFYQGWDNYKKGFGNIQKEFWLGLEKINLLTGFSENELLIEMLDWDNYQAYARYHTFTVGSEEEGFMLKILEGYSGNAGECIIVNGGMRFTTKDKDQDLWTERNGEHNCARWSEGAWWYRECKQANPTGKYYPNFKPQGFKGMYWSTFHGDSYSLKKMRMLVRPRLGGSVSLYPKSKFD